MRTTITCLAGSLLLLAASLLPARAAPATEADPAVWGVYAKLLGRTWEAPGKYSVTVNWAVPGEIITETWISPTTRTVEGTVTVTRGAQPGELVAKSSPVPMKWTGRIVDADTVVFERAFPPRLAYRISYGAAGFDHQRVKLDGGAVVAVTASDHYTATVVPGAAPVPGETRTSVAEGGKKGGKKGAKSKAAPASAPVGPHPVRVVGGTEVIAATFKDGVSGIDDSGARYDCYLIDTRPGDRWEVQVEADDSSVPNLVVGQFRSVDAADCGASRELTTTKRKEAWLSYKQTYSMTAGGGYYWFMPAGLPERSYTLRFKRKEGKVDAGMAVSGVAQLPAPLAASDRGPVTPVLEDASRRKQRVAGVEAVYARLAGRTYRGQDTWNAEREQLSIPFKQYQWRGKGGELKIQGGLVLATGVQADPAVHSFRVDPVAGVFRSGDDKAYVEHLPADGNALRVVVYARDGAGRRTRTSSVVMSLLPDGGQAFDGKPVYAPTTPAKLAALAPSVQQDELARRAAAAEERRLLAEQQAREEQEGGDNILGRALGGALMGAMLGGGGQNSIDLAVTGAQAAAQGGNTYEVLNSMGQVATAKAAESERQLNETIAAARRQAAEQEAAKQQAARAEAEARENARQVAEAAARQHAMDADAQRVAEAARAEREAADAAKRDREARLAREQLEAERLKQQAEDERKRREAEALAAREKAQAEAKARADQARRQNETKLLAEFRGRAATCAGGGKDILFLQTSWPSKQGCNVQFEARCPGAGPGLGVSFGQSNYVGGSCMGIGDAIRIGPMPCQAEQVEIRMTGASCPG